MVSVFGGLEQRDACFRRVASDFNELRKWNGRDEITVNSGVASKETGQS